MIKIKNLVSVLIVSVLLLSNVGATGSYNSGYKDPIIDSSLNFTAKRDGKYIITDWSTYTGSNFKYYKVIRSETLENPVYPDNGYIKAISNNDDSYAKVANTSPNSAVYRVCVITSDMNRYCSKTVKLAGYEGGYEKEEYKPTYEKTTVIKETTYESKYGISSTLARRADKLVAQFAIKIEEKFTSDSDKINAYETIIGKLEDLAEEKENLKNLIDYIVKQMKSKMSKYNTDFDEIEEIFGDF